MLRQLVEHDDRGEQFSRRWKIVDVIFGGGQRRVQPAKTVAYGRVEVLAGREPVRSTDFDEPELEHFGYPRRLA